MTEEAARYKLMFDAGNISGRGYNEYFTHYEIAQAPEASILFT